MILKLLVTAVAGAAATLPLTDATKEKLKEAAGAAWKDVSGAVRTEAGRAKRVFADAYTAAMGGDKGNGASGPSAGAPPPAASA